MNTDKPVFKNEPVDKNAKLGETVKLSCDVEGNPEPEIVWTHESSQKVKIILILKKQRVI